MIRVIFSAKVTLSKIRLMAIGWPTQRRFIKNQWTLEKLLCIKK